MASKVELAIETLKISLDHQNPTETLRIVEQITQPFADDELTGPENDVGVSKIFDAHTGLLVFFNRSMKCNSLHKNANVKLLELFEKIIGEQTVKVIQYVPAIIEVMLKFIFSSSVAAVEKEHATLVLQSLVSNNLCADVNMTELLAKLLQVFHIKKTPGRFLQNIYVLLGMCARDYPDCAAEQEHAMRNMFLETLERSLLTQIEISFPALTGAFQGLNYFLVNFAPNINDEPQVCHRIYSCVKKMSNPPEDFKQLQIFKASLDLFAAHSDIMATQIFADHQYWHTILLKWLHNNKNREYRKTAFQAIHSFHRTLASCCELTEDIPMELIPADALETSIVQFYINYFKTILLAPASKPFEIRIAIRGFGLMSGACSSRMPAENVEHLLTLVMQRTESACREHPTPNQHRESLEHYPDFVQALSQIMKHILYLSNAQITSLQTIIVSLIRDFCYLSPSYHRAAIASLLHTFNNLAILGAGLLHTILERCVLQGVIWTCSHKLLLDSYDDWATNADWKDHITFETFLPLWNGLIVDDPDDLSRPIKRRVYRHLLDTLFLILDRVNLSTKPRPTGGTTSTTLPTDEDAAEMLLICGDPNRDLVPVNQSDFHLFFNVVQLYERLFADQSDAAHREVFQVYDKQFFEMLSRKCDTFPLVSGFVRLIAAGLRVASRLHFFDTPPAVLVTFVGALVTRVQRTQGELQFAGLECIFAAPTKLLERFAADLVPVYRIAFELGRAELRIASAALRSLERLTKSMGNAAARRNSEPTPVDIVLRAVLPCLDGYLQAPAILPELGELVNKQTAAQRQQQRARRKRVMRLDESGKDTKLVVFQKQILMFLGTLDPHTCLYVIQDATGTDSAALRSLTKPDADQLIRLTLHFGAVQPKIYMDALVPRVCALATGAPDRSTKIAACELTHSLVLYVIGTRNYGAGSVWRTLCGTMLRLGSDGDVAVRQMFEPLLMQLMHYMSQRTQISSEGVSLMCDCLMDGVSDGSSSGVRDMAARCLSEFVEWSARQNTITSSTSILEILHRLKLNSFDSAPNRRVGAAVAFNHLHRLIREEEFLLDLGWLDLLYTFAINFLMSEQFRASQSDLEQSAAALRNVARVLQERAALFNAPNEERIVPPAFADSTLRSAIVWLFGQCAAPQMQYRRKCIQLVQQLAPFVDRCGSTKALLRNTQTLDSILLMFERQNGEYEMDIDHLLVTLDAYIWLIGNALVDDPKELVRRSMVLRSISEFLGTTIITIVTDQQNAIHAQCLERIVEFLLISLPVCADCFTAVAFWTNSRESLVAVIIQLIFAPHQLNVAISTKRVEDFIVAHHRLCPLDFSCYLDERLRAEIQSRYDEVVETAEMYMHSTIVPTILVNSAAGIGTLQRRGFALKHNQRLLHDLFDGLRETRIDQECAHSLQPDVQQYARSLIRIALHANPYANLIDLIFSQTILIQTDVQSKIPHGSHFLNTFTKPIFECMLRSLDKSVGEISARIHDGNVVYAADVLRSLAQFSAKHRTADRITLKQIVVCTALCLPKMFRVYAICAEPKKTSVGFAIVELVTHLAMIHPEPLLDLGLRIDELEPFLLDQIAADKATVGMEMKARCVFLLPCLIDATSRSNDMIEAALRMLQANHFPLRSTEFPDGSLERSSFGRLFQSILDALVASQSPLLLRFVIHTTAAEETKHILEHAIGEALTAYVRSTPNADYMDMPMEVFNDRSLEPSIRLGVMKRFVLPMLRASTEDTLCEFLRIHLHAILDLAASTYGVAAAGWAVEHALVSRIGAYKLIETMVGKVSTDRLQKDMSLMRSLSNPPKSLIGLLTAKTMATRADIFVTDDPVASELFRCYQCATFAAICSLVANTQTDMKFYEKLLFKENPTKNELIWQKIIDCRESALYTRRLTPEFDELPKQKERIVSIRGAGGDATAARSDRVFLQTQHVFESSLSQDMARIDLSVRTDAEVAAQECRARDVVQLERVPINDHEVMATLCAVIRHMFEKDITPSSSGESARTRVAPLWAKHLCRVLEDSEQPRNVRYFVAKVVDNCRTYFRHYAVTMTGALLAFLADECAAEQQETDSSSMNFVVMDLTITLLEWNEVYTISTPDECESGRALLKFLMRNAWHERKEVFKQRLEVIRCLVQAWREQVALPRQELFDSIARTRRNDSRDNLCGIQLNAIVLCAQLIPWSDSSSESYFRAVLHALDNDYANVYQPASYLMGMVLHRLVPADQLHDHPFVEEVGTKLERLRINRAEEKRFTDILFGVHRHFPSIVSRFLVAIGNFIPKSAGAIKRIYLELFLTSMDVYETDVFRELVAVGLTQLLRSDDFQLMALHCVNKALPKMTVAETESIMAELTTFVRSKSVECRRIVFEIFIYIVTHMADSDLQTRATTHLLVGLTDAEATIKARVFRFWANCNQLPASIDGRILGLLDLLYDPLVEEHFLAYGTELMLDPAIRSADAKRPVFPHQPVDDEAKLTEYDIDVSWSGRNSQMRAPLFMQSQQRQLSAASQLRATQNTMLFEPTQDPDVLQTRTAGDSQFASLNTQTSLLFSVAPQMLNSRSQRVRCEAAAAGGVGGGGADSFGRLRERFMRVKGHEDTRKWVDRARSGALKKQTIKPHRRVQLFRRYRHGDYPDLLINNLALLLPLQALAQHDRLLAGQLFVAIFSAVIVELGAADAKPFLVSCADFIQRIFARTKHCDPIVFSAFMELALLHPQHFEFAPDLVSSLAISNRNLALAICYLERRLHHNWHTDCLSSSAVKSSKSNASTIEVEQQHWLKLIELYRALAESDVVAGVFVDKLDVDGHIPRAIALELSGNLEAAQREYREVIERGKIIEQDLAYQSFYALYERLGDWSALAATCVTQVDHLEQLWDDDWSLDTLLPHIMRARCRQLLNGEEECRPFVKTLEQWVRVPAKAQHLNVHFGEELMMMHLAAGQHNHARVYADRRLMAFLSEWPNVTVLSDKVRCAKILSIRTVAEMHACAQLLLDQSAAATIDSTSVFAQHRDAFAQLAKRWQAARPQPSDSTCLWHAIVAYRGCVAAAVATGDGGAALRDAVASTKFRLMEVALLQGNVVLANRLAQEVPEKRSELPWLVARSQHQSLKACLGRGSRTCGAQAKLHLKAWDGLRAVLGREAELASMQDVRCRALDELSLIGDRLAELVPQLRSDERSWTAEIQQRIGAVSGENLEVQLHLHSLQCLQQRVQLATGLPEVSAESSWFVGQSVGEVYFRLASFCQQANSNDGLSGSIPNSDRVIIESLLRAMRYGSKAARRMLPWLLEMPALHTDGTLQRDFVAESDAVPEWMFLGWIPQLLSVLSFERATFLDALLLRIARVYPLAISYPFRLSYDHYHHNSSSHTPNLPPRAIVQELLQLVHNPTVDSFVRAMLSLCVPEKKLAYHLRELFNEMPMISTVAVVRQRLASIAAFVWPEQSADAPMGRAYERIDRFKEVFESMARMDSLSDIESTIHTTMKTLRLQTDQHKVHLKDKLTTLSPWLSKFQWCGRGEQQLELPGQYGADHGPPCPAKHVHIVKFDESIEIYASQRLPIRLRMHGSDGRTYSFLAKYGEDLRQDQRVQQLLQLMREQLHEDAQCRAHALRLETFAVIPLSVHCGMLGWVEDCPPMQKVAAKWMDRRSAAQRQLHQLCQQHTKFIVAASGSEVEAAERNHLHYFGKAASNYSRIQIINAFREIEYAVPNELIRGAIFDLAATPESFYALRTNFASSLAALSVAHWLLGIGDRHLSNVLLNVRTGRVVGIDFGFSFGAGTRDQDVPELIPFRMTPQFVAVMNPLAVTGVISKGMGHALRCFREGRVLLQSCMEVFVREPTINWLVASSRDRASEESDGDTREEVHANWDPAQRIDVARRKLAGANPRTILTLELAGGNIAAYPQYLAGYSRLLAGHEQHNVRARMADDGLTADEQVQCLLDMATDQALLGVSWSGFQPWI